MGGIANKRQAELDLIQRVTAQCKTAVITGPAAARWLDLSTLNWVTSVDLALPGGSRSWGKTYPDRIYRSGRLLDHEHLVHNGIRTATAIRAMFDTFRYYGRMEALVQIESARFKHEHLTTEYLLAKAATLPHAPGIRPFRALIEHSTATSASPLETRLRDTLLQAVASGLLKGVETLEFQVGFQIVDADGWPTVAWADALINGFLVLEADGREKNSGAMGMRQMLYDVNVTAKPNSRIAVPWCAAWGGTRGAGALSSPGCSKSSTATPGCTSCLTG